MTGDGVLTLDTPPGGVVAEGVGRYLDVPAQATGQAAQVGAEFSGVTAARTLTVEIPDSGEVGSPRHGAKDGVLV